MENRATVRVSGFGHEELPKPHRKNPEAEFRPAVYSCEGLKQNLDRAAFALTSVVHACGEVALNYSRHSRENTAMPTAMSRRR